MEKEFAGSLEEKLRNTRKKVYRTLLGLMIVIVLTIVALSGIAKSPEDDAPYVAGVFVSDTELLFCNELEDALFFIEELEKEDPLVLRTRIESTKSTDPCFYLTEGTFFPLWEVGRIRLSYGLGWSDTAFILRVRHSIQVGYYALEKDYFMVSGVGIKGRVRLKNLGELYVSPI